MSKRLVIRGLDGKFFCPAESEVDPPFPFMGLGWARLDALLRHQLLDEFDRPINPSWEIYPAIPPALNRCQGRYFIQFKVKYVPIELHDHVAWTCLEDRTWQFQEVNEEFVRTWEVECRMKLTPTNGKPAGHGDKTNDDNRILGTQAELARFLRRNENQAGLMMSLVEQGEITDLALVGKKYRYNFTSPARRTDFLDRRKRGELKPARRKP